MSHGVKLLNCRPHEQVEVVLRRHWIVYVIIGLYFLVGLHVSFILWYWFHLNPLANLLLILFWMPFSLFLYMEWMNHELDMYVVTNNRIIGIEQISFLNRVVSECNLGQVQEVNSSTKGLFSNLFNYGTLSIQTAGKGSNFIMEFCPDVLENARKVLNVVDHYRDEEKVQKNSSI